MENNNFSQQEILDFKNISQKLGSNSSLVQAAGGNTSIKSSESMLIKASGTWLINSKKEEVFVPAGPRGMSRPAWDAPMPPVLPPPGCFWGDNRGASPPFLM